MRENLLRKLAEGKISERDARVPALENKPELYEHLLPIWDAFCVLSRSRTPGFAPSPISMSDLAAYLALTGVDDAEERREYLDFVQAMDREFSEWANKKK